MLIVICSGRTRVCEVDRFTKISASRKKASRGPTTHLEHASLGVLATTTEKTRRLDPKVADLLLATVEETGLVLLLDLVLLRLGRLLFGGRHALLLGLLGLEVRKDGRKVALVVVFDLGAVRTRVLLEDLFPVAEKVLDKDGVLDIVRLEDRGEKARDLLGLGSELDLLACSRRGRLCEKQGPN